MCVGFKIRAVSMVLRPRSKLTPFFIVLPVYIYMAQLAGVNRIH